MTKNSDLNSFLRSEQALEALKNLRKGDELASLNLSGISPDDRTYLEAEDCVRSVMYSQLETRIQPGTSPWVINLVFCYRDLFTNPERAFSALDELEDESPIHFEFPLRLNFWRTHLNLILGRIEIGRRNLTSIASKIPDSIWKNEMLTIRAMGYYFIGRTHEALVAHHDCQNSIKENPDLFLQTFDCGMATRAALKLCDPASFEYFSERLDASLRKKDDSRYRLRHTGYRALIFNQLGEHDTAEIHWKLGDEQLHKTESALERGQYLTFRGMSFALVHNQIKAKQQFDLAKHDLKLAGSPAIYLAELDIAEHLADVSSPEYRSINLKVAAEAADIAFKHFSAIAESHVYPLKSMYTEAAKFCDGILNGSILNKTTEGRQSLALSVIENVSSAQQFAKQLSHFRLIPDFIHRLSESDLTNDGLLSAMQSVLRVRPVLNDGQFRLPGSMHQIEAQYEVKTILEFASTLFSMGTRLHELSSTQSRLKEAERARHLLHDIRPFIQELSKKAKQDPSSVNLSRLSDDLNALIESYLKAMVSGENPAQPTIVSFPKLLEQVIETTKQSTGKQATVQTTKVLPFLWISDELLKRLLINLIKNGIEAGTGSNPVSITYKIEEFNGNEKLVIYISDNGKGLNPKLFEAITNDLDSTDFSSKQNGLGIGLKSAIERAKELGIELTLVPSTRSTGTTFKLGIPLPSMPILSIDPEIIVIDDSPCISESWRLFGEKEQIPIKTAYSDEAVALMNNLPKTTAWVILDYDLKLPRTTGADLVETLIKLGTKVALSTGFTEQELPKDVFEINWDAVISKEPQYPNANRKKVLSGKIADLQVIKSASKEMDASIQHEIRNELTPLRTAFKGLQERYPNDPYVGLFANSLKGIERLTKRKTEQNAAS